MNPTPPNNAPISPQKPILKSITIFMQVLRVLFFIKGIVFLIAGIVATSGGGSIKRITDTVQIPSGTDKSVLDFIATETMLLGIVLLLLSITLFLSAWLCKRVIIRNRYITHLEEKIKNN